MRAYFKELHMVECFAKQFTNIAPVPLIELLMELKKKSY
jgi:hypothetical protein